MNYSELLAELFLMPLVAFVVAQQIVRIRIFAKGHC